MLKALMTLAAMLCVTGAYDSLQAGHVMGSLVQLAVAFITLLLEGTASKKDSD